MMDENKHSYAGDSMRRVEDEEMITGAGCYTDDLQFPEMTHLKIILLMLLMIMNQKMLS